MLSFSPSHCFADKDSLSVIFLPFHHHLYDDFISEPSAPNPTSEAAPSIGGPNETVKAPSDPSLSPCPSVTEKETPKDGDLEVAPEETEEEKAIRLLYCSLCKVAVNSASQLQAHNSGKTRGGFNSLYCFNTLLI